jgi:aryl-alcohol dehydrogenase-like predicted oxidoreductase
MKKRIGFGTYRITEHNPEHLEALTHALKLGVNLIDTSSNYMNGEAECAIAKVFATLSSEVTDKVEIVSKFGYIQGPLLEEIKANENKYKNVVKYSDTCYHSIESKFISEQLTSSLSRLNIDSIDCYLIHNPEYYILDSLNRGLPKEKMLDEMLQRIYDAFLTLENEVALGRIKAYGISSNSFSKSSSSEEFLPYEDLVTLAEHAAKELHIESHHFTTIELPINMIEREGLKCAKWAKANGLHVLVNRALNAQYIDKEHGVQMYRIADYSEPSEYYHHLNALLELTDVESLQNVHNLIGQLDDNRHKFTWIGAYDNFLYTQILPHLRNSFEVLDEQLQFELATQMNDFLTQYAKMVAFECSKNTKRELASVLSECTRPLQECALQFLDKQDDIDTILIGMRKLSYVNDILNNR